MMMWTMLLSTTIEHSILSCGGYSPIHRLSVQHAETVNRI